MQRVFIIDRDFFAGSNIAQGKEKHVTVNSFHESVGLARMIDVVRAVAATRSVQTEATIDVADAQDATVSRSFPRFQIRNSLAGIFGNLLSTTKSARRKAALAIDWRFLN